ncbi:prepilin-type N-terminal cleavage/methylation domain-containing protein [Pseudogemmatithrix spongiicola]|uniref:Prepilin-type N-terminal cleavage/methylation domain-containing protein n=1 Tax=Pseudogemmatithrix spongiicola TaxID=3062599 RepID=A0AA49Q428_9BACT|nr:prepilin-type N-terminal cleavage/methylation domain-containing protein [Gemmatimonadaceae bacterium 'strain 138']WKW14219.1 prepilin-type N-terminal cleavage/methylation domain-containing protein [Gemmatimonadaceae bacterium 'strain 318']
MQLPRRPGFTVAEILVVIILIGLVAGWTVSRFTNMNYRMDANIRMLQNTIIAAQQTAINRNMPVQLMFDASSDSAMRVRILLDADDDGQVSENETVSYRPLDGARFLAPDSTIDGASAAYATGPGLVTGRPALMQALRIAPNGTLGGDVVIYIGTVSSRSYDFRALAVTGATARTAFWSHANGAWRRRSY